MIEITQAFVQTFVNAAFGLGIAHENKPYKPTHGTPYAELIVFDAGSSAYAVDATTKRSDGLYRVILRYPTEVGAIVAKQMADTIFAAFAIGSTIAYNGVGVQIVQHQIQPGSAENGWYKLVLTMRYVCFHT